LLVRSQKETLPLPFQKQRQWRWTKVLAINEEPHFTLVYKFQTYCKVLKTFIQSIIEVIENSAGHDGFVQSES
jgi:hypothetical protein